VRHPLVVDDPEIGTSLFEWGSSIQKFLRRSLGLRNSVEIRMKSTSGTSGGLRGRCPTCGSYSMLTQLYSHSFKSLGFTKVQKRQNGQ